MSLEDPSGKIELTALQLEAVALSTIKAVIGDVRHQYLSGPITGGRKLLDWHKGTGRKIVKTDYRMAKELAVVKKNIQDIQLVAKQERDAHRNTIEPGSFEADFPCWGQDDFLRFWEGVIRDHSSRVLFMNGWEFSSGCAFEFLCARKHNRPTFDMCGAKLTNDAALALLDNAICEIVEMHDAADPRDEEIVKLHAKIVASREKVEALG